MRTFAATIFAAICTYSNALTLQDDRLDEYVKCDFNLNRDYPGPSPYLDATVAVKLSAGSPSTVFDFGFERGEENSVHVLYFFLMGDRGNFDYRRCTIQGYYEETEAL